MKKILVSSFAVFLLVATTLGQSTNKVRPAALGISFFLNDYTTAQRIRSTSLSSVLANKKWAKVNEMAPGLALTYFKGISNYVDFAGTLATSFINKPFTNRTAFSSDFLLMEADASLQLKLVTEDYWVQPHVSIGAGAQHINGYFGAFIPVGAGFKVNLYDEAHLYFNSQYRVPVTQATSGYRFVYNIGVAGVIGKKKVEPVKPVVIPVVIPEPPKDSDSDGVTDDKDKCPDVKGLVKYNGCPIPDSDKDGINDEEDKCPTVAGLAKYQGCPIPDTDKDAINDEEDKCPTVAGVARYQGCPVPDTDKDGINDEEDKCPTVPGIAANNGCPEVAKETVKKVEYSATMVLFETGSAKLLKASFGPLNDVVKVLNTEKSSKLSIEGYADNVGDAEFNLQLSNERAASVKAYLIEKGIEEGRLTSKGFGEEKPVADNNTTEGRRKNRRVNMILGY